MKLRADHVAGAFFVAIGLLVIGLSGALPFGQLSMPGAGFLPRIVATLTIVFGAALVLRAGESGRFSEVDWSDGKHAAMVTVITIAAIALYTYLGYIITMALMVIALLVLIERRNPLRAAAYGATLVLVTYACFVLLLKTPLPASPFSY